MDSSARHNAPARNLQVAVSALALAAAGCASSAISDRAGGLSDLGRWERSADSGAVTLNWLAELEDSLVTDLLREALAANFALAEQRIRLDEARQGAIIAGADRWPTLTATLDSVRRDTAVQSGSGFQPETAEYRLGAGIDWELDLWGELSAAARAASLDYEAALADYEAARRRLVADTAGLIYDAIAARHLLELFQRRLENLLDDYRIVAGGYRRGINGALDVYLAQSAIEQQRESVANQHQSVLETTAALQLALARYPDGSLVLPSALPLDTAAIPAGLPSELLTRRQDIRAAWLSLLAADARLAVAHKNRFPRLALSGTGGRSSQSLDELLDRGATTWSLASGLTQALFSGGRLKAEELQARARAEALEQQYLALVYGAFAEVENAISRAEALEQRYEALLKAERNAAAALDLAFDQYQRGLVSYTTVLESQRRAFDSETALVSLQNELVQNRIGFYRALGGEFALDE